MEIANEHCRLLVCIRACVCVCVCVCACDAVPIPLTVAFSGSRTRASRLSQVLLTMHIQFLIYNTVDDVRMYNTNMMYACVT